MIRTQRRAFIHLIGVLTLLFLWTGKIVAQNSEARTSLLKSDSRAGAVAPVGLQLDGDYRVGSGDTLDISVWKEPEVSSTVVIRPDGKISLPLISELVVTGKTPLEIQAVVAEKLSPYINSPNVTVTVREVNSKKVYVLGEVGQTGSHQITQPTTVLQILTESGGLRPFAKQKSIYVLRTTNGKQEKIPFNYKDVVQGSKMEQNIFLQPGDIVVVP